jgi:hypothetical protein
VDVDGEDAGVRLGGRHPGRGLAHAEADLQHDGPPAEHGVEIEDPLPVHVEAPRGPQPADGVGLAGGHTAPTGLEAPDAPLEAVAGGIGRGPALGEHPAGTLGLGHDSPW